MTEKTQWDGPMNPENLRPMTQWDVGMRFVNGQHTDLFFGVATSIWADRGDPKSSRYPLVEWHVQSTTGQTFSLDYCRVENSLT